MVFTPSKYNPDITFPPFLKMCLLGLILVFSSEGFGQDINPCGQHEHLERVKQRYPDFALEMNSISEEERETLNDRAGGGSDFTYTIPVVFHVIHDDGPENISSLQIYEAMEILNAQMSALNEDLEEVVDTFATHIGNPNIEFKLAKRDPEGDCTNGINRVQSELTYDGMDPDMKNLSRWPRGQYLNVWICNQAGNAAGFSNLPNNVSGAFGSLIDGIVLRYNYVGISTPSNESNSKTFVHEVGHWLNLRHTWGPGNDPLEEENCDFDDGVNDTPLTRGWTSCILGAESCGSLDNIQNYMEYSGCRHMFTHGQGERMRNALTSLTAERFFLWQESNLEATGVSEESLICAIDYFSEDRIVCLGNPVRFRDLSYSDPLFWEWNFGDGTVLSGDDLLEPEHFYETPGIYDISLSVSDGNNTLSLLKEDYITVLDTVQITPLVIESFEDIETLEAYNSDWANPIENIGFQWELSSDAAHTGLRSAYIDNHSNDELNQITELISAPIDFSNNEDIYVSYKWAFATLSKETDDKLRVYISDDCGESWDFKRLHRGFSDLPSHEGIDTPFTPQSTDDWNEDFFTEDDEEYMVPGIRIKFQFESKGGNNIYLDDINIGSEDELNISELLSEPIISVFPNPTSMNSTLKIQLQSSQNLQHIRVMSGEGKTVMEMSEKGHSNGSDLLFNLPTENISAGSYFIQIILDDEVYTKKWIYNKQ